MTALAESQRSRRPLLEMLAVELAWREGRWAAVARIASGCAITVAIAMVFQIPQPTYMAYIVFLISKDEKNATVTSGLGGLAAVTLAILLVLGPGAHRYCRTGTAITLHGDGDLCRHVYRAHVCPGPHLLPGWLCHRVAAVAGR